MHQIWELQQMQSLPLSAKVVMTQQRIREWYEHWDGMVYVLTPSAGGDYLKMPHPGQLRHLVEIGQTVNGKNENGYPAPEDSIICRVWAAVEDDSSRFYFTGDADNAERGLAFIIRWRADIRPGMWIIWNGEKQTITKLGEYDFKRRYLKLTTESIKGVT